MRYEPCAVHLQHQYVVHHPYLSTRHELHLALVTHHVNGEAHTVALVYMASLGEELDVERLSFYISRRLRMHVASDLVARARVYPLPLLAKGTEVLIALPVSLVCHHLRLTFEKT